MNRLRSRYALTKVALALPLSMALILSACGGSTKEPASSPKASVSPSASGAAATTPALSPVELVWYYGVAKTPSSEVVQQVEDEVNKITKKKINATVKLKPIDTSSYNQKMNVVVASGEPVDLMWTASWNFTYAQNASKGAFYAMDDLLDKYAPNLKKSMPDYIWAGSRVDGKIYAAMNYGSTTNREGFVIQKQFIDKYSLDISTIKKFEDIEPFLEKIKAGEKDITPLAMSKGGAFGFAANGLESISGSSAVSVYVKDPYKAVSTYETPEYKQTLATIRRFMEKGLINADAPTLKNTNDLVATGKVAVMTTNSMPAGGEAGMKASFGGKDVKYVPLTPPVVGRDSMQSTMTAISRNSKNPERAMMLIDLTYTDEALYNLLSFGAENKNYTKVSDKVIKLIPNSGYDGYNWTVGNSLKGFMLDTEDTNIRNLIIEENKTAQASPLVGFTASSQSTASEEANIKALKDEYFPMFASGLKGSESKYAEFTDKLKKAGIDKMLAEYQKQLDAFKATKK